MQELSFKGVNLLNFSYINPLYGAIVTREQFRMRMKIVHEKDYAEIPD